MLSRIVAVRLLLAVCLTCAASAELIGRVDATLYLAKGKGAELSYEIRHGSALTVEGPDAYLIRVVFIESYNAEGWDRLELSVNPHIPVPDTIKAHAAGYSEAYFTTTLIFNYWENYRVNEFSRNAGKPPAALLQWVRDQDAFVRDSIEQHAGSSSYWRLMSLVMAQFDGLCEGYWATASPEQSMTYEELYLLQSVGDLYDLNVLFPRDPPDPSPEPSAEPLAAATAQGPREYRPGHGALGADGEFGGLLECSALIVVQRVNATNSSASAQPRGTLLRALRAARHSEGQAQRHHKDDMLFWAGHTTWRPYYAMRRVWKVYNMPWSRTGPVVIASSPGLLHSKDDWYTTDRLVIIETTNGIYNQSLYDSIHPRTVLTWQRVMVATYGSVTGREWVDTFARHNSGTYNNGWMVLDVHALEAGGQQGVLWLLEQVPGLTDAMDVSSVLLTEGFWAAYNVPYSPLVYNISGYPAEQQLWQHSPRAQIFRREAAGVRSLPDLKRVLRYNRFQTDPLSAGKPSNAIAARYDLLPTPDFVGNWTRRAFGAVDAKVTDLHSFRQRATHVICGPTADDQEPFRWSTSALEDVQHEGVADAFEFGWQKYVVLASDALQSSGPAAAQ